MRRDVVVEVVLGLLLGAGLVVASVAWGQPPQCDPPAYAHVTNPDHRAQMIEALEAAHAARPEERDEVRKKAGLTPGMARACANIAKEKGKPPHAGRPDHAGGGR